MLTIMLSDYPLLIHKLKVFIFRLRSGTTHLLANGETHDVVYCTILMLHFEVCVRFLFSIFPYNPILLHHTLG